MGILLPSQRFFLVHVIVSNLLWAYNEHGYITYTSIAPYDTPHYGYESTCGDHKYQSCGCGYSNIILEVA